jgi:putative FmdB family regulatory protein
VVNRGYICDSCDYTFEVQQSMHEQILKKCPQCERLTLYQDLRGQYHAMVNTVTLGQLAEKNTKKMGRYEFQAKEEGLRQEKLKKNQDKLRRNGVDLPLEKCEHKPWYGKLDNNDVNKINKMTPEQKVKYIVDG